MSDKNKDIDNFSKLKERLFGNPQSMMSQGYEHPPSLKKQIEDRQKVEAKNQKEIEDKRNKAAEEKFKEESKQAAINMIQSELRIFKSINNLEKEAAKAFLGIKDNFSYSLKNDRFNRIDFSNWKPTVDFLINYCNTFSIPLTLDEQINEIKKSSNFINTFTNLHNTTITAQSFTDIINRNKPLITFRLNIPSFFRKNILFMKLYVENQKNVLDIGELPDHWLKSIISYPLFSNFKSCIFLNKTYKRVIEPNKLSTIKYFNEVILGEIHTLLKEQLIDSNWITSIRRTYHKLFGKEYENCKPERKTTFRFFSTEELDMFIYILVHNISISETFPIILEPVINEILVEEGINPYLIEKLNNELSEIGN